MRTSTRDNIIEARLLSLREASSYIGRGQTLARKYFDEINATRHYGKRVLFDRKVIDKALDEAALIESDNY